MIYNICNDYIMKHDRCNDVTACCCELCTRNKYMKLPALYIIQHDINYLVNESIVNV